MLVFRYLWVGLVMFVVLNVGTAALPDRVADLKLSIRSLVGEKEQPFRLGENKAALLLFVTHDCPISNAYAREYARIRAEYVGKKVATWLIYVDPDASSRDLARHQREFGLADFAAIHDHQHKIVSATGATVTPEAVVIRPDGKIEYRGRVDNLYADYGKRRRKATVRDVRDALDAVVAGKPVKNSRTEAIGCFIPPLK